MTEDVDEFKDTLPPVLPGLKVRIPPELMPDDETALQYFELYFTHVHPYVPVLSKTLLYQQWNANRDSISPLVLEAVFAIGGRLADEPAQGQQWLALASSKRLFRFNLPILTYCRACGFVHGCAAIKHITSTVSHTESPGGGTEARLLFPVLDDGCSVCPDGQGSGAG